MNQVKSLFANVDLEKRDVSTEESLFLFWCHYGITWKTFASIKLSNSQIKLQLYEQKTKTNRIKSSLALRAAFNMYWSLYL